MKYKSTLIQEVFCFQSIIIKLTMSIFLPDGLTQASVFSVYCGSHL